MAKAKIKVLIVDDSALIRALLNEIIVSDHRLEVVAMASDPYEARELIKKHDPDVITLDIEMPKMNGIAFLKNLMRLRPVPVVMISTLTQAGAPATLEALEYGAVDFLGKPKGESGASLEDYRREIVEKVYWASKANVRGKLTAASGPATTEIISSKKKLKSGFICAIGASTGGTEAIKEIVKVLPADSPPLVVTQHIPDVFSTSFAKRLDSISQIKVYEAEHNQVVEPGCLYLAPGHSHMKIGINGSRYVCKLNQDPPVNRHRPSVEVLFESVLSVAGPKALGVLLTGMGADGAEALLRMMQAGCMTIAQDEESSVVWGMPGVAVKLGAAQKVLPLEKIAANILKEAYK